MKKAFALTALVVFCMAIQCFPGVVTTAQALSASDVWAKIEQIKQVYPSYSYFSANGQACTHDSQHRCDNCTLENINPGGTGGLPTGATVQAADGGWSATCVAFSRFVFYSIFGVSVNNSSATGHYYNLSFGDVYLYAYPGDHIDYPGHNGIFIEGDSSGFWMYESNFGNGNTNQVRYENHKHTNINITVTYALNYNVQRRAQPQRVYPLSGMYVIHSAWNDNICLNVAGGSTANNANIELYHRVYSDVQKFRLIRWDESYYCISSPYNGGRWFDAALPIQDRSNVKLYDTNEADEDFWFFEDAGGGYVYIKNKTGLYLDVQGDQGVDNANVQLYHFVGNNSQKWRLEDVTDYGFVSDGVYTIQPYSDGNYRLNIQDNSTAVRANIELYQAVDSDVQQFHFTRDGNSYTIQSVYSGLWLDIKTPIKNKSNVQLWSGNTSPEEHWTLENAGDGSYYIRSNADYYLDVEYDSIVNNANIQVYRFTGSAVQKWRLVNMNTDNAPPQILSYSVTNLTATGYDVTVTAADNTGVSLIAIETWNDNMSSDSALRQTAAPDAAGTAVFHVNYADFDYAQNVTYHTNAYAYDAQGNACGPVRVGDPYVKAETTYTLSVYCEGNVSRPYGIFTSVPAGTVLDMSTFDFHLTDEENAEYVFGRYDSSLVNEIFDNNRVENAVLTMPECDVTVTKVYYHRETRYSTATFCASYGGTLYVYDPETDTTYWVSEDNPVSLSIREGADIALLAEPWDFYGFSSWNTTDFWVQYTSDRGADWLWVPMQGYDTWLRAEFYAGPYAFDNRQGFILPESLTVIEEEAFANVDIKFFYVQSNVTAIGSRAFPEGSVVYLDVSSIGSLPLDAIADSGVYIDYGESPDMEFALGAVGTQYTVLDSHGNIVAGNWSDWSDWSVTPVEADSTTQVETKTQFSYRDTTYETRYTEWSAWSGWTTERQETSDLKREESTPLYIWYWYECPSCGHHDPTYGSCRACGAGTTYSDYEIWLLPVPRDGSGTYQDGSRRAYDEPGGGTAWYNDSDNSTHSYIGYRYSTRTTYQEQVVSEWSEYADVYPAEQANREIRTRTVYRYRILQH